ncbi:MAG: DUF3391 domain-containing protein, partial [Gammaproteobacteria bacterium]|nr:DUF3391 domain-containing protein [Gammaproteobacteria bacterium]
MTQQIINIDQLQPGMFVDDVLEQKGTLKIKTQGLVSSQTAVNKLVDKGVLKVSVDLSKSKLSPSDNVSEPDSGSLEQAPNNSSKQNVSHTPFDNEISRASKIYQSAKSAQSKVLESIKNGD